MDDIRTDEHVYWNRYEPAYDKLRVSLKDMDEKLSWIRSRLESFKSCPGSQKRAEMSNVIGHELRVLDNVLYRDALNAANALDDLVQFELVAEALMKKKMEENNE